MRQGQSSTTPHKEDRIYEVLCQRLLMTKNMPGVFWYMDLNAGCGWNADVDCPGSPVIFLRAAMKAQRPFRAIFVEKDADLAFQLQCRLEGDYADLRECWRVWHRDNREALPDFTEVIRCGGEDPADAVGCLLCDPNGLTPHNGFPLDAITVFAGRTRRIDILYSLNFTAAGRVHGCYVKRPDMNMPDVRAIFGEALAVRQHHLIAPPPPVPGWKFSQILMTNTPKGLDGWHNWLPGDDPRAAELLHTFSIDCPRQLWLF